MVVNFHENILPPTYFVSDLIKTCSHLCLLGPFLLDIILPSLLHQKQSDPTGCFHYSPPPPLPSQRDTPYSHKVNLTLHPTMQVDGPEHLTKSNSSWPWVEPKGAAKVIQNRSQFQVMSQYLGPTICSWLEKLMFLSYFKSRIATRCKQREAPGADPKLRFL